MDDRKLSLKVKHNPSLGKRMLARMLAYKILKFSDPKNPHLLKSCASV